MELLPSLDIYDKDLSQSSDLQRGPNASCTSGDWIRVAKLTKSAFSPSIGAGFGDCEEKPHCRDIFKPRKIAETIWELDGIF